MVHFLSKRGLQVGVICLLMVYIMAMRPAHGQVTFSRDWNAGKRVAASTTNNVEQNDLYKSIMTICHILINQIRQLANYDELGQSPAFAG